MNESDFLHVDGAQIVNARGEIVHLRGFCIGGWMTMENFMTGHPGHEAGFRAAVADVLGSELRGFFFERFLNYFFAEEDVRFIRSLGCTVIRVALNYRHFESDDMPFTYKPEGFARLDQVIEWAHSAGLYVILDLHAAQGYQSSGWHCDNPGSRPMFWDQISFQDRAVALWEAFATHYKDEPAVAGYNVLNEPEAIDVSRLNKFYRRAAEAIRAIDPQHILFLEGNIFSQQLEPLDPPFAENLIYSTHYYVDPGLDAGEYPGVFQGQFYDRAWLKEHYAERAAWTRHHHVPHWFGEFGCIYGDPALEASRLRVMVDLIDIADEFGDHWTIWNYKDIGKMGLVYAAPNSKWMKVTEPVRRLKTALRCDYWIERQPSEIDRLIDQIESRVRDLTTDLPGRWDALSDGLRATISSGLLSQMLLPAFAHQFRGMGETEIDTLMQSFALNQCVQREGLIELLKARLPNREVMA